MKRFFMFKKLMILACIMGSYKVFAQTNNQDPVTTRAGQRTGNIYVIKQQFLEKILHNPTDKNLAAYDNELERFNRWFNLVEPRCYPTGDLPQPSVILDAARQVTKVYRQASKTTSGTTWVPLGPVGLGRINCIVIDPLDTGKIYAGAACGGVWISHNSGLTWTSACDTFPSLSIADIAVNPHHTDTLYAATGDGYGYVPGSEWAFQIFWGGLYSGGVMKSTNGGASWHTTGLSYLQTNNDIIQKLLIHPRNPDILLAATRHGIFRTTDAGTTWTMVDTGHVFSMAFRPFSPDTIYAVNSTDLRVSYDAGNTWSTLHYGINSTGSRCSIATSPASPNSIWALDDLDNLNVSHDAGNSFLITSPPSSVASFYGYYDRVLAVSPFDSNIIITAGLAMAQSADGGYSWNNFDPFYNVHSDNHAIAFSSLNPNMVFSGNDGGVFVTRDAGNSWTNLSTELAVAQIYRMSSSRQSPYLMLCGLQDNGTLYNNSSYWAYSNSSAGDGEGCLIYPGDDYIQLTSYQYGVFSLSTDQGATFTTLSAPESGNWTTPAVFSPNSPDTIYFGYNNIFVSYDMGYTYNYLTDTAPFSPHGAVSLAIAASNSAVLYAADFGHILRTTNRGTTWADVTAGLPGGTSAITHIAVDYTNPMKVYVTLSGYTAGEKLYYSNTGGTTWINISNDLPNIPANCVALDSSTNGAIFVGTDLGVYYTDSSLTGWIPYNTGLPNVIVNDLEINYTNYKLRAATYGRGIWETNLRKPPLSAPILSNAAIEKIQLAPNPSGSIWKILFPRQKPNDFTVRVSNIFGQVLFTTQNSDEVEASSLPIGVYNIEIMQGENHYILKAVRN